MRWRVRAPYRCEDIFEVEADTKEAAEQADMPTDYQTEMVRGYKRHVTLIREPSKDKAKC